MTEYLLTPAEQREAWRDPKAIDFVAQAQLDKCIKEAKPVWQREAVEMVFERIEKEFDEIKNYYPDTLSRAGCRHIRQEILDKIK